MHSPLTMYTVCLQQTTKSRKQTTSNNATGSTALGTGATKRSRKGKRKEDSTRIIDPTSGRDITPKSLIHSNHSLPTDVTPSKIDLPDLFIEVVKTDLGSLSGSDSDSDGSDKEDPKKGDHALAQAQAQAESRQAGVDAGAGGDAPPGAAEHKRREWQPAELQERISIRIAETETLTLLHIPSLKVWGEDRALVERVEKQNEDYRQVVLNHKESDKFSTRAAQTFNKSMRHKAIRCVPPEVAEQGTLATTWDIYDAHSAAEAADEADEKAEEAAVPVPVSVSVGTQTAGAKKAVATASTGAGPDDHGASDSHLDASQGGHSASRVDASQGGKEPSALGRADGGRSSAYDKVLVSPVLAVNAKIMEEAVIQNEILLQQLLYRNFINTTSDADIAAIRSLNERAEENEDDKPARLLRLDSSVSQNGGDEFYSSSRPRGESAAVGLSSLDKNKPGLYHLWSYECPLTQNRNVSCMAWNRQNPDLLAVGYGSFSFGNSSDGMVLFWSLRNPGWPQKAVHTPFSVTALDFSTDHAHLLAAGMYDGSVAIYDIREKGDKPSMESAHATGKHSEPVWGVRWVNKDGSKRGQVLTSVSTDGTIKMWSMKKGLVPHELMLLKRVPNKAQLLGKSIDGSSREASPLCLDFPLNDGTQYFTGTEDGLLHKCSSSYNEQTLATYFGHTGPVYKVRCSPFHPDAFISCSADWTLRLWDQKSPDDPVLTMQSGSDCVTDVSWAPANSCIFGCVSRDGRVEIWDLEKSPLDPFVQLRTQKEFSCLLLSENAPVLVTGDSRGSVDVYRLHNVDVTDAARWTPEEQVARLADVMVAHNENRNKKGGDKNAAGAPQKTQKEVNFAR
jgi:WD40 repeat protein